MTETEQLEALASLWREERDATREKFEQALEQTPFNERVERGLALADLEVSELQVAPGDKLRVWLTPRAGFDPDALQLKQGSPARIWREDPNAPDFALATIWKIQKTRIGVYVDSKLPRIMDTPGFNLDMADPQVTFKRGANALSTFIEAPNKSDAARLRRVIFSDAAPATDPRPPFAPLDPALNEPQRDAVQLALDAQDIALIHGPPGTGKTRTLIEVIRQCVERGERVLASAASNLAVDNLAERLLAAGVNVVRLGHPARVTELASAATLDAKLDEIEIYKLARKWMDEANALRRKIETKAARGSLTRSQRREQMQEVWSLMKDARRSIRQAQAMVIGAASVVCATATGTDTSILEGQEFDTLVLDEATQAADPIALIPMTRARRVILAGDPFQLPPTIISQEAERAGLGTTIFERLREAKPEATKMLEVQHRMNEEIMRFPCHQTYSGKLTAHPDVADHTLEELGYQEDPVRFGPLVFIDAAGKGWEEARDEEDPSTSNPEQATRTTAEVRRILSRGVPAHDIAVITPYRTQVTLLRSLLEQERDAGLEISTVDGYQGREKEVVVVDLVRSNDTGDLGFLTDTRRMNVALTRARRLLLIIGDSATIGTHRYYAALLDSIQEHGAWVSAWADDAEPL